MAIMPKLQTGFYNILSQTATSAYVGVPPTRPTEKPVILVYNPPGVEPPVWKVDDLGNDLYLLSIGGYNSVNEKDRVWGRLEVPGCKWLISYAEFHDAYTTIDQEINKGWTVPVLEGDVLQQILLEVVVMRPSQPPQFLPSQLFKFIPSIKD